jgi:hypothetical protein
MAFVEDEEVIQTFSTNRADHPLDVGVLPGSTRRSDDLSDIHRRDPLAEDRAATGIAIAQQKARSRIPRERFGYLTRQPARGRMPREITSGRWFDNN